MFEVGDKVYISTQYLVHNVHRLCYESVVTEVNEEYQKYAFEYPLNTWIEFKDVFATKEEAKNQGLKYADEKIDNLLFYYTRDVNTMLSVKMEHEDVMYPLTIVSHASKNKTINKNQKLAIEAKITNIKEK